MSYTYRRDFHELWSTPQSNPLQAQSISLKNRERLGIEQFLLVTNAENAHSPTVILPDASSHLVLRHLEKGRLRCRFIGPRTSAVFIDRKKRVQTYIIRFQADSVRRYLPFPLTEITDQSIDLMETPGF